MEHWGCKRWLSTASLTTVLSVLLLSSVLPLQNAQAADTIALSGQLLYQDGGTTRPIRLANVQLLVWGGLGFDPVAETSTDLNGFFRMELQLAEDFNPCTPIKCHLTAFSRSPGIVHVFDVSANPISTDPTNTQREDILMDTLRGTSNLGTLTVSGEAGEAFRILDSIVEAWLYIRDTTGVEVPEAKVIFPCGLDDLCFDQGRSWFDPFGEEEIKDKIEEECFIWFLECGVLLEILLAHDPGRGIVHMKRGEDTMTDIHEYGHYVMWRAYGDRWPISIDDEAKALTPWVAPDWPPVGVEVGCPLEHSEDVECGPPTAWTEGWADFLASAVLGTPAGGNTATEILPANWPPGAGVEGRVAGALWDLFDDVPPGSPPVDGCDSTGISVGFWSIFETLWNGILHENFEEFVADYMTRHTDLAHYLHTAAFQSGITEVEEGPPNIIAVLLPPQPSGWYSGRIQIKVLLSDLELHGADDYVIVEYFPPQIQHTILKAFGTLGDEALFSYSTDRATWFPITGPIEKLELTSSSTTVDEPDPVTITTTVVTSIQEVVTTTWDTLNYPIEGPVVWLRVEARDEVFQCAGGNQSSFFELGPFGIDNTPPDTVGTARPPDSNGWYNEPVTITWSATDSLSSVASCDPPTTYSGPDATSVSMTGQCSDYAGNTGSASVTISYDATSPETRILSARDGSGASLTNGGLTLFGPATFTFEASDTLSGVIGFECSVDNSAFAPCSSGFSGGTSVGTHTFQVRAFDAAGNVDPTPEVFSWTVISLAQATQNLIDTVKGMGLATNTQKSLLGPLTSVLRTLLDTNPNNDLSACRTLEAFVTLVDQYEMRGLLNSIQAASLRQQAANIQVKLGCP